MCDRLGKDAKLAGEQARKDRTEQEPGIVEKELMNGRVAKEMAEARKEASKAPRAANLIGTVTRTKEGTGSKEQGQGQGQRQE